MRRAAAVLILGLIGATLPCVAGALANVATSEPEALSPLDPDELAALLADLEALGGILSDEDLAMLVAAQAGERLAVEPAATATGLWLLGADLRQDTAPRLEARLRRDHARVSLGGRLRRQADEQQAVFWVRTAGPAWQVVAGAGSLGHGGGLLTAPLGARSSLDVGASLLPSAPGWRPSLAVTMPERLIGVAMDLAAGSASVQLGSAQDREGRPGHHLRLAAGEGRAVSLGVLGLQRDRARAVGAELRWRRGPWRLNAETCIWRRDRQQEIEQAWLVTAGWRHGRSVAEIQAASSRAGAGMPQARLPASLPGWLGEGWAWRLRGQPLAGVRAGLVGRVGEARDHGGVVGRRQGRHELGAQLAGRWSARGTWELRWRRQEDTRESFDPLQPWLPVALESRRVRSWQFVSVGDAIAGGTGQVTWRRLEEAGRSRQLIGWHWQRSTGTVRWRAGWQSAWGDPLNLVTVSAPISSMIRIRHWGSWDSGLSAGCEGRGRWRWQLGGELRRRSAATGGGLLLESRLQWGRVF